MTNEISGELPTERSDGDYADSGQAYVFTVVEGPDAGAVHTLDASAAARLLIGKSVTCKLRLEDREVSRRHASVRFEGKLLVLADLGSTNGTRVNNVAIREATLTGGEAIRLGRTVISVTRGAEATATLVSDRELGRLLGASRAMRRIYPLLKRLATNDAPVLVEGEAGSGKELCAEEIHAHSTRGSRPFVVVACQTLAAAAIEEHLFGPEGALAQASGGTLFIDEVAALPIGLQRRFAIAMEQKQDLGVRLVFATSRDLDRDVESGSFREDLLVKLAPWRVEMPPLRDREGDVELLARAFWKEIASSAAEESGELPVDFLSRFHRYRWPGNVRELAAAVSARFNMGELSSWRGNIGGSRTDFIEGIVDRELPLTEARQAVVDEFERRYIDHMLKRYGSNRDAARASAVGIRYFQIIRSRLER